MTKSFLFKTLFLFLYRVFFRKQRSLHRNVSYNSHSSQRKYHKYSSLAHRSDLSNQTLIFNVEGTLLKSSSLFSYFMLVAFEAGGLFRSVLLFLLYPFICIVNEEIGLKIMIMVCFFGIKKDNFRVGTSVLPKFFLEDVGLEIFEILQLGSNKKIAVSNFPRVMVESFLKDYMNIDFVVGRELKLYHGYFIGIMEDNNNIKDMSFMDQFLAENNTASHESIGITGFNKFFDHRLFSYCKNIYLVSKLEKKFWNTLPKEKYPKSLIFHDGRLALKPGPIDTLAILMWVPFGFSLMIFRMVVALTLPYDMSCPILVFSGLYLTGTIPKSSDSILTNDKKIHRKGLLYVCNHRTLLDPLYLSFTMKKNFTAVTYSLSRMSEILSPIKTVRLTRSRDEDAKMMDKLLNQGDLVVCPEGTTCREPYLLRFSPLFSEISEEIIPVAIKSEVSMFHGTTAGGLKCLDPVFFLMNPSPIYTVQLLDKVSGLSNSSDNINVNEGNKLRFEMANYVQSEIGKVLKFECTKLTRRDKYLILAGNEGIASTKLVMKLALN